MTFNELEALSVAELKERHEELADAIKGEDGRVLAKKFLRRLQDAKARDEKLTEQGKTIQALQDGLLAAKANTEIASRDCHNLTADLEKAKAVIELVRKSAREVAISDKAALDEVMESLKAESERATRLKAQATRHYSALAAILKTATEAVGQAAVEEADNG